MAILRLQNLPSSSSARRTVLQCPGATVFGLLLLALTVGQCAEPKPDAELQAFRNQSEDRFSGFQSELQKALMAGIQAKGAAGAIGECKTVSPALEQKYTNEGSSVRRISAKPRNPANAPDAFEAVILREWEQGLKEGRAPTTVARRDGSRLRVLKPIRIPGGLCLNCHGDPKTFPPALQSALQKSYPEDKATGYRVGQLRGAFSATRSNEQ